MLIRWATKDFHKYIDEKISKIKGYIIANDVSSFLLAY